MQRFDPTRIIIPWAQNAAGAYIRDIPNESQIGQNAGAASFSDGWPALTAQPLDAGGLPPDIRDANGINSLMTQWLRYAQAGIITLQFNPDFAAGVGGYPIGAVVESYRVAGKLWLSTLNDNSNDPDSLDGFSTPGWIAHPSTPRTGQPVFVPTGETLPGYCAANGLTIGSATSGANSFGQEYRYIYCWVWSRFSQAECPVPGGRGASGIADFLANKPIVVPNWTGCGFIGCDPSGTRLASVPAIIGSIGVPGSQIGENLHTNTLAEIPATTPAGSVSGTAAVTGTANVSGGGPVTGLINGTATTGQILSLNNVSGPAPVPSYSGGTANIATMPLTINFNLASTITASGSVSSSGPITAAFAGASNGGGGGPHNNVERSVTGVYWMRL